ncbi:hypothetical protein J8655_00710 [Dickeya oryzae]|nr:hypothetical protein [Dickeya oryzae]
MRGKSFIVTAGMLTVLLTGCERNTASSEAVQPVAVTVQTLHGAPVTLHSELTGRVTAATLKNSQSTGSVTLCAGFPNAGHMLLPGMFVRAAVETANLPDAILAPQQGILRDIKGNAYAPKGADKVREGDKITAVEATSQPVS